MIKSGELWKIIVSYLDIFAEKELILNFARNNVTCKLFANFETLCMPLSISS